MNGFKKFLLRGNAVELAVAVVIGAAFGSVISAFVSDFLTPLVAAIGGQPDFGRLAFTINDSRFAYGHFVNAVVAFLMIAAVVYFLVVMPMTRIVEFMDRKMEETERDCPECLSSIPIAACRCRHCTVQVVPATETPDQPERS